MKALVIGVMFLFNLPEVMASNTDYKEVGPKSKLSYQNGHVTVEVQKPALSHLRHVNKVRLSGTFGKKLTAALNTHLQNTITYSEYVEMIRLNILSTKLLSANITCDLGVQSCEINVIQPTHFSRGENDLDWTDTYGESYLKIAIDDLEVEDLFDLAGLCAERPVFNGGRYGSNSFCYFVVGN